jgi:predicted branched-subunit amino acid permease
MDLHNKSLWEDWGLLFVGIALLIAPFLVVSSVKSYESISSFLTGVAIILVAFDSLGRPRARDEWLNLIISVCMLVVPFVLRVDQTNLGAILVFFGFVVAGLSIRGLIDLYLQNEDALV